MVYSISWGFRAAFLVTASIVIASVASVSGGPFLARFNAFSLAMVGACLLASLYQERWIFDRESNVLERNVGLVFLHTHRRVPLDTLREVVLRGFGAREREGPGFLRRAGAATLAVVNREGRFYRLAMASGGGARELQANAERLAAFCGIPLQREGGDPDARP